MPPSWSIRRCIAVVHGCINLSGQNDSVIAHGPSVKCAHAYLNLIAVVVIILPGFCAESAGLHRQHQSHHRRQAPGR
jgi:hypothetical protein